MERKIENNTEIWMKKHKLLFLGATKHPFIQFIHDGSLQLSSFENWLEQEYWLVKASLVPFQTKLVQRAKQEQDDNTQGVIERGISFRNEEISWIEKQCEKFNVSLSHVVPQQATKDYSKLLESLVEMKCHVALTILWAIESVYHHGFGYCLEGGLSHTPEDMKEAIEEACRRWGGDEFGEYCRRLQSAADRALENASDDEVAKAEVVLLQFLEIAVDFWNLNLKKMQPN